MMSTLINTYKRLPIAFSHGKGCYLWDTHGNKYLDALAGIAVNTLGYSHPDLVEALNDQLHKVVHCSNYYQIPLQEQLGQELTHLAGLTQVFFCNSGLEANEAAIKLALKYGVDRGVKRPTILVCESGFHGRSFMTMAATANTKVRDGFGPLPENFLRVPFNDIGMIKNMKNADVVAVFFETIQGEGGIHPAHREYLQQLRLVCDEKNWLLILDEVQCGMARTGRWFAYQWADIYPDVLTLAKGLGSGIPIGAMLVGPKAHDVFKPGNHGTTFGGNPLSMRAGITTIEVIKKERLLENVQDVGNHLLTILKKSLSNIPGVVSIRGQGLMIGIELNIPCIDILSLALQEKLLVSVTADRVIRIVPPLILTKREAEQINEKVLQIIQVFFQVNWSSPL